MSVFRFWETSLLNFASSIRDWPSSISVASDSSSVELEPGKSDIEVSDRAILWVLQSYTI